MLTPTGGGATTNEGPPQPQGPHKPPGLANVPPEDPEAEEVVETETPIAV